MPYLFMGPQSGGGGGGGGTTPPASTSLRVPSGPSLPPPTNSNVQEWQRVAQNWIREANKGNLPVTGRVTLDASSNTTTVRDNRVGAATQVTLTPLTANAAMEWKSIVVTTRSKGSFVLAHTNNALTDRQYTYAVMG